jgi:TolB protein
MDMPCDGVRRFLLSTLIPLVLGCSEDEPTGPLSVPDDPIGTLVPAAAGTDPIAFVSQRDGNDEIYRMNPDGSGQTNLTRHPGMDTDPVFSPDGSRIAFTCDRFGSWDICVMNADGTGVTRLTSHPALDFNPTWSADGARIAFASIRASGGDIFTMRADGSDVVQITHNSFFDRHPVWSPDGSRLAFETYRGENWEIFLMNPDGSNQVPLANHPGYDFEPTWSPDASRIAWRTGRWDGIGDVAVTVLGSGVVTNLTQDPAYDQHPSWSPDGTRIAYAHVIGDQVEIYSMATDGSGKTNLSQHPANDASPFWGRGGAGTGTALLTVTRSGKGRVTSAPAGINCGSDCSESYAVGTAVTLTATPLRGSTFTGWSGACSGTGACTLTMSADKSVTATFAASGG